MKKKISLFVCMLMAALCFIGCSGNTKEPEYDIATMEETAEAIISSFSAMADEDFAQYKELTEFQLNYVMMNSGLRIDAEDFLAMIDSWQAGVEECGAYISHGDFKVEVKSNGVVLSTETEYENRKTTLRFSFSEESYLESLNVSGTNTSGLNKVPGMGTVVVVLIVLVVLMYLWKYMPNIKDKIAKKDSDTAELGVQGRQHAQAVECIDDLELVAVITAAIAAQEGTRADGFVVRSIRRRPSNKWR